MLNTQRVGRVQRKEHEHDYKMGYLFLPVILDEVYFDIGIDACVNKYQYILDVLTYLKESDSQIKMFFNQKDKPQEIAKKLFNYIEIDSFDEIKEDSFNQFNELIINIVNRIRLKVYGSDDNEDKWNMAYAKVIEFYKLFNCFPRKRAESDNEKILGSWCAIQKTLYKKNLLTNEKIKLLDEIDFKWDEFQEKWNKRFLELENFIKKNNFLPQNMRNGKYTSKNEKGLRKWFNDQRFRKKENTLEQWKIIKLDVLLNNLNFKVDLKDNDEVWEESYQKFMQFVKENKKLPTDVKKDSNQRMVYIWYLKQREKFQNNELTKEQIQKLNICKFKWNQDKFSLRWDNNYKELVKLNKKYGGIPSNSKIYTENNLIKWYKRFMKKYKEAKRKLTTNEIENFTKLKNLNEL